MKTVKERKPLLAVLVLVLEKRNLVASLMLLQVTEEIIRKRIALGAE